MVSGRPRGGLERAGPLPGTQEALARATEDQDPWQPARPPEQPPGVTSVGMLAWPQGPRREEVWAEWEGPEGALQRPLRTRGSAASLRPAPSTPLTPRPQRSALGQTRDTGQLGAWTR